MGTDLKRIDGRKRSRLCVALMSITNVDHLENSIRYQQHDIPKRRMDCEVSVIVLDKQKNPSRIESSEVGNGRSASSR
jgi:hypothetical protein